MSFARASRRATSAFTVALLVASAVIACVGDEPASSVGGGSTPAHDAAQGTDDGAPGSDSGAGPNDGGGSGSDADADADAAVFDPLSIPDLALWLDAERGLGTQQDVRNWTDQVSKANARGDSPFDGDAGSCVPPVVVPNEINGRPVVRFDGSSSCLVLGNAFSTAFRDFSRGLSLFVVAKPGAYTGTREAVIAMHPASRELNESIRLTRGDQPPFLTVRNASGTDVHHSTSAGVFVPEEVHAFALVSAANGDSGAGDFTPIGSLSAYLDGAPITLTGGTASMLPTMRTRSMSLIGRFVHGGGHPQLNAPGYFRGDLAEIMIFRRAITKDEREKIDAYLREKWL